LVAKTETCTDTRFADFSPTHVERFIRLFTRHEPRVFGYILSLLGDPQAAEDVLQETNLVLWKKFDQFGEGTNFFAWACRIARLEVLAHCRRVKRDRLTLTNEFLEVVATDTESMADELQRRRRHLYACLQKLRPTDRDLIQRRYGGEANTKAVAEQVGRPLEGVYKAIQRIRRALLECVSRGMAREAHEA